VALFGDLDKAERNGYSYRVRNRSAPNTESMKIAIGTGQAAVVLTAVMRILDFKAIKDPSRGIG
jgi:hypothetical protein